MTDKYPLAIPTTLFTLLLLVVQLVPPLPLYFSAANSMALGTSAASALLLLSACTYIALSNTARRRLLTIILVPFLVTLFAVGVILAHLIVADTLEPVDLKRAFESFAPLFLILTAGFVFGKILRSASDHTVNYATSVAARVFIILLCLIVTDLEPRGHFFIKPAFPFTEASHFALAFTPILMYRCIRSRQKLSLWWLFLGFVTGVALQSLSLLVGCLIIAIVSRRVLLLTALAGILGSIGLPFELTYFTSRLDFTGSVLNLSNLVYIQGWQLIGESLARSHGWGLGFQQLGLHGTNVPVAALVRIVMLGDDANLTDGSFVFSKLASEFGVFGIILTFIFLICVSRSAWRLRNLNEGNAVTLARCIVVSYSVDMFVRGPGYFVESTLLFLVASSSLITQNEPSGLCRRLRSTIRGQARFNTADA